MLEKKMGKKRQRDRIVNTKPFLEDDATVVSRKQSKAAKNHQQGEKMISQKISSIILKEAICQRKEIDDESEEADFNKSTFSAVFDEQKELEVEEDSDDDVCGFSDTQSQSDGEEEEIDEEEEQLLEKFLSKMAGPQPTLGDIIAAKIREKDATVSSEPRPEPKFDNSIIEMYKGVGKVLSEFTTGKIPKAFKRVHAMEHWEEILYLTEPEKWSPHALFEATRIFASNMNGRKVERFYKLVLLPRIREDIRKNKKLHHALYKSVKKSLYKPAAFNKGILLPLCASGTCTLREAVIIGGIITRYSIPPLHGSVALLKLAEMGYCGTTSYFIKLFIDKKYGLPYRVIDALVAHFLRFLHESRIMPVIWHQSLLSFVQRYKNSLQEKDKEKLRTLVKVQKHRLVTPEILRELNSTEDAISSPVSVIKPIEEDRFDIPEIPMEED